MRSVITRSLIVASATLCAVWVTACCCGSEFQEGFNQGLQEGTGDNLKELEGKLANCKDSPEKDDVAAILADAQKPENTKNIGFSEHVEFLAAFEEVVQDNVITPEERDKLKKLHEGAIASP